MNSKKTKIKDIANIEMYLKRIAYQIYEDNHEEDNSLIIVGVEKNGKILADKIFEILKNISSFDLTLMSIQINKKNPTNNISSSIDENKCLNKNIIIVDDVLNTGKTLIYAVDFFLKIPVKKIQTAVIINRNHKKFPIKADFKGISLSTSIKEHIDVVLDGSKKGIYLS
ncbi:MAG: phosphoribosyltransferase [Flavobacteriaceae bacterium]|nr:phosphoribosyltransferase [Flavobacteriaceae bacterium]|tara:strand:- start:658 stop:1164 length:507 start_codon:yes stop_codon:yes gene_type:complete